MKWNWWKKDNSTLEALKEALDEINSLKCELKAKEQIKEYDELIREDE